MTGRDLIIFILQNNLEDRSLIEDGKLLGFMSISEAAYEFGVGVSTVKTWIDMGTIVSFELGNDIYIPVNCDIPNRKGGNRYEQNSCVCNRCSCGFFGDMENRRKKI